MKPEMAYPLRSMLVRVRLSNHLATVLAFCSLFATPTLGTEYHVNNAVACSIGGPGTVAEPYCTIQPALDRLAGSGDAVIIHTGVYAECPVLAKAGLHGSALSPIRIEGAAGEDPAGIVIDASAVPIAACLAAPGECDPAARRAALTVKGTWSGSVSYLRVARLTVRPPSFENAITKNNGVDLQCVDHVELTDVRSDRQPAFTDTDSSVEVGDAVISVYAAKSLLIDRVDISNGGTTTPGFQAIAIQDGSTSDVMIVRSRIRDVAGGFVCQSGGVRHVDLYFNDVAHVGAECDGFNVVQAYNVDYIRLGYNRIVDHAASIVKPRSYAAYTNRSSLIVSHNLFRARGSGQNAIHYGYAADADAVGMGIFHDNVFVGYENAFRFDGPRIRGCQFVESRDAFLDVGKAVGDASGCGFAKGSTAVTSTAALALDSGDCPSIVSPLIDRADPRGPTPRNGTRASDIGACEFGEPAGAWSYGYDFKPVDASPSASPRITWDGADDVNVNLKNLDFKLFLRGAPQTQYECQVDSVVTFNSQGIGKPIWSSGTVPGSATYCTVPVSLPPGDYFARVRLNGQFWSDLFKFSVGEGATSLPPSVQSLERTDVRTAP